jgi:predicted nucleic acid-binding protein
LADKKRVYWDACIWFALIKQEPGRYDQCAYVLELAKAGELEIWTSSLTLAEVFRKKCGDGVAGGLAEAQDQDFEAFLSQDFVVEVQVDHQVGIAARRLLRAHVPLKKPQDAIHLASAVLNNLDEFHTFDQVNLLCLNGLISTKNGGALSICEPPTRPLPEPDLFTALAMDKDHSEASPPIH